VIVLVATRLEAWAARRVLPGEQVVRIGVGARRDWNSSDGSGTRGAGRRDPPGRWATPVLCGLCGALEPLPPGTIVIPEQVASAGERPKPCDPALVDRLVRAARSLGREPVVGRLLTAPRMVTGVERRAWAGQGFQAVDMEAAEVLRRGPAAVVRVVLDTPAQELSPQWERAPAALLRPSRWRELVWLARAAPTAAMLAAAVVRAALA
jgi:4-hydroxy-3-methylbut-2-en-1-yl diphosphate reductase